MKINEQQPAVMTLEQKRRVQDRNIQSVFSEVLMESGRAGYASAESSDTAVPLADLVEQSWHQWYQVERLGRYASPEAPQDLGQTFGNVLNKAYNEGAYVDPKAFLSGLSSEELDSIQSAHWLANSIEVNSLSEEGALNLLLPPAAQVDVNRDGLTQSGAAYSIRFPNSTTPPEVVVAWDAATADLTFQERMTYELEMMLPAILSNIVLAPDGSYSHTRSPGDPDFSNPMAADDYSYVKVTQDWIGHLDYFKSQLDPVRYERDRGFWSSFQEQLHNAGAK
ncbi:hypothetical protein N9N28_07250 [Rubripirellula amarantea]|uniref:Uncharacterized protein n=1 Tax=Rubripirellula amarantea TaxID=2527999 RepID=A0A5C5WJU6_9BACT|nr:hypothetical protein [Rubripirellula amarantea]MDA8744410.1 hypothetical protein [Rubripirellula amarantea]TWT50847.1 hypothetical protein Pla22_35900 [Rubripirellula amarantea]